MELINRIRKSRKGFTLVEIIVVLVILAILAAFTIPAMLGFVNDAKGKARIAQAREVYVAAQAAATETVATKPTTTATELKTGLEKTTSTEPTNLQMDNYIDSDIPDSARWTVDVAATGTTATGKVNKIVYTVDKYVITIDKIATGAGGAITITTTP